MADRLIAIRVSGEQYDFLDRKGNKQDYIRRLIQNRMDMDWIRANVEVHGNEIVLPMRNIGKTGNSNARK